MPSVFLTEDDPAEEDAARSLKLHLRQSSNICEIVVVTIVKKLTEHRYYATCHCHLSACRCVQSESVPIGKLMARFLRRVTEIKHRQL